MSPKLNWNIGTPPSSEQELLRRCCSIEGMTVSELSQAIGKNVPCDMRHAKGYVGQLLEKALGASAGSASIPDFPGLGIELKSIPVDHDHKPRESTFVCHVSLASIGEEEWETCALKSKLQCVLWIPVQGSREIPLPHRRIGTAVLWRLSGKQEATLREDWEELAGRIGRGEAELITGHMGNVLQLRPKGVNAQAHSWAIDEDGGLRRSGMRAFYLRSAFTHSILRGEE